MAKRAILLANGMLEDPHALRDRLAALDEAEVIGVDGGSLLAASLGLTLDALVGDFDSLEPSQEASLSTSRTRVVQASPSKDETDLELAVLDAVEHGAEEIIILGAVGGRLDMTIANVFLLLHPRTAGIRLELWHGRQTATRIVPPEGSILGEVGDTVSLLPLAGDAHGVTTTGLRYILRDETLAVGPARGVSNVMTERVARIQIRGGTLLAVHTSGRA
jgi:thiamine pyrophosphokinase